MAGQGVFAGLRVLELGSGAASPVASRYFTAQGARVIRVESAKRPDFLRLLHVRPGSREGLDAAPMFALLNPDKQSLALNLKRPEAAALARRLVAEWADVVSENFSPGVMAKWGLDYESLRAVKPDLVMISGCLFGQTGPQRGYPGFGGQGAAIAGFNHVTGWPDREGIGPYGTITDSLSPRYVALLVAAALLERRRSGHGQYIDLSQIEVGVYSLSETVVRASAGAGVMSRRGNRSEHAAPHGIYPCRGEDRWIALAVHDDGDWRALRDALGDPDWARAPALATAAGRVAEADALDTRVAAFTRERDAAELAAMLQAAGMDAAPVQDFADLHRDPQLAHREHFRVLPHPHLGPTHCEQPGLRLSAHPHHLERAAPDLGEHSRSILTGVLGLSDAEVDRLVRDEVVC